MAIRRDRQKAFQIPILAELAVDGGKVDIRVWNKQRSEELNTLVGYVFKYFEFTGTERRERNPGRQGALKLDNDLLFAVDQLEEAGELRRNLRESWEITEKGLRRLRAYLTDVVRRHRSSEEIASLMATLTENEDELQLSALKRIAKHFSEQNVSVTILASTSLRHLFQNSLANMPLEEVGPFLASGYEAFKPLICRELTRRHGIPTAA